MAQDLGDFISIILYRRRRKYTRFRDMNKWEKYSLVLFIYNVNRK